MANIDATYDANGDEQQGADQSRKQTSAGGDPDTPDEGEDSVEEELEIARRHADPSKGDKVVDGGDHVSTEKGGNPQE